MALSAPSTPEGGCRPQLTSPQSEQFEQLEQLDLGYGKRIHTYYLSSKAPRVPSVDKTL